MANEQPPVEWGEGQSEGTAPDDVNYVGPPGYTNSTLLDDLWLAIKRLYNCSVTHRCLSADLLDGKHGAYYGLYVAGTEVGTPNLVAGTGISITVSGSNITIAVNGDFVTSTSQFTADNRLIKTDRPTSNNRVVQQTGITVDDSNNVTGVNTLDVVSTLTVAGLEIGGEEIDPTGAVPVGTIVMYGAASAPTGWLLCNGAIASISSYPTLGALLGSTYGGNGTTTFGVPDLRGRSPVGYGAGPGLTSRALNDSGGSESATLGAGSDISAGTDLENSIDNMHPYRVINFIIKT